MSLKDWLLKKLAGDHSAELELSEEEENLSGLNLKNVIDAHFEWRNRLESALDGSSREKYDTTDVEKDNLCTLGKWLYGPGKQLYSKLPEYKELLKIHAEFHICASEILIDHGEGYTEQASKKLDREFNDLSSQIQIDLVRLFTSAKAFS